MLWLAQTPVCDPSPCAQELPRSALHSCLLTGLPSSPLVPCPAGAPALSPAHLPV